MALIQNINVSTPNDGLGDTLRASQVKANANFAELNAKKVEIIPGYGLSENNFSDTEQAKLAGIEDGAQVNVIPNFAQDDPEAPDYILNKPTFSDGNLNILDGIIGVTDGFIVSQQAFVLPAGSIAQRVYINNGRQLKETIVNSAFTGRWTQSGDIVTITESTFLNDYIEIEYL